MYKNYPIENDEDLLAALDSISQLSADAAQYLRDRINKEREVTVERENE